MKGRHVVILVFVFGLSLMAILFRLLPTAKPPPPPPAPPPVVKTPPAPQLPPLDVATGAIEVSVKSKGVPIPGATVSFEGARRFQLATDEQGKCRAASAEAGSWRIVARAPGVAASYGAATVERNKTAMVELELAAGVKLEGFVRDEAGNPVPGARVALNHPDPGFTARTDANGRYALNDVPIGTHSVTASSERLRPHTVGNIDLTAPGAAKNQDFILKPGLSVAGRLVDEAGAPVVRATVTLSNEVARVVRSDENGEFKADGLGEGTVVISVVARGYATTAKRDVKPGTAGLVLVIPKGAIIKGRCDVQSAPFTVTLSRYDEELMKWIVVRSVPMWSETGDFEVADLPKGQYQLTIETKDRKTPAPLALAVESGMTVDAGLVVLAGK